MIGLTSSKWYTDIARAIRSKLGVATKWKPSQMADAIRSIPSGADDLLKVTGSSSNDSSYCITRWELFPDDQDREITFKVIGLADRTDNYLIRVYFQDYLRIWLSNGTGSNGWVGAQYGGSMLWNQDLALNDQIRIVWTHTDKKLSLYVNGTLISAADISNYWETTDIFEWTTSAGLNGKIENFTIKNV